MNVNEPQSTKKVQLPPRPQDHPARPALIGNGTAHNHEGLATAALNHYSYTTFHKTPVSSADEAVGFTRFYRWHIDAALYDLSPPRVTTLYAVRVPLR